MASGTVQQGRVFTPQRQAQGFRSQAHLDAFYVHYDHTRSCPVCSGPGSAYWSEADASWQPCGASCETEQELFAASLRDRPLRVGDVR